MARPGRILLVDDDQDILHGAVLRINAAGFQPITASNGEDAVASAAENQPDAIVLDVRMPGLDGLAALRMLREQDSTRHIPVVMLSASLIDQKACLDAGARFFVAKPYAFQTLLAAIHTAIDEVGVTHTPKDETSIPHTKKSDPKDTMLATSS